MRSREIIAKVIRGTVFEPDDLRRVFLHIPVGLANVFLCSLHWSLAFVFGFGFVVYELAQDSVVGDDAFKDIKGWLWGMFIGGVIWWLIR